MPLGTRCRYFCAWWLAGDSPRGGQCAPQEVSTREHGRRRDRRPAAPPTTPPSAGRTPPATATAASAAAGAVAASAVQRVRHDARGEQRAACRHHQQNWDGVRFQRARPGERGRPATQHQRRTLRPPAACQRCLGPRRCRASRNPQGRSHSRSVSAHTFYFHSFHSTKKHTGDRTGSAIDLIGRYIDVVIDVTMAMP